MRRVLALFLSVVILFSFVPTEVGANSFVKEIDAVYGGFILKVNGKSIAGHKEPFLYNEELFISLIDLAKGLDMGISISGNTAHLDSKGKLNKDLAPIVFQRGYEILAKERILEDLHDEIRGLEGKAPARIDYKIKSSVKNIKVGFGGISIYLDKKKLSLDTQPIKYKNDIYVSLDSIAPYLYITPSLSMDKTAININSNGVLVRDNTYSTLDSLLSMREGRNYLLDLQKAELDRKKHVIGDLKLPYKKIANLKALEDYLRLNFNKVEDLTVDIKIEQHSNFIYLDLSFPNSRNYLWHRLKRSDVEQWIWKIYTAILNLYDKDILISGAVRNPLYNSHSDSSLKNYITFYTKDSNINFDFSKSKLSSDTGINIGFLMDILNSTFFKHEGMDFSYETSMSGDNLNLVVRPGAKYFKDWPLYMKMGYLKALNERIRSLYPSLNVDGRIVYPDDKLLPLNFYFSENRVRSTDLLQETMNHLNINFSRFSNGSDDFALDYTLYEKDLDNFYLSVIGDFSVEDDKWINTGNVGKMKLDSNIHNALSYIFTLWNANISTEVLDKNGVMISEFEFYQKDVSVVSATPTGGEIPEGTSVILYTDTPGAKIYYTTDGSTPTTSSNLYGMPIEITRDTIINAFGYKDGLGNGPVSTFKYTVVKNEGLSYGLTGLNISDGVLSPSFARDINNYTVNVGKDVFSIDMTPYASTGVIKVGNDVVSSGQPKKMAINNGANTIVITVKESNKQERRYTITVNKEIGGENPTFKMEDLRFNTLFSLIFSGRITSNTVSDFSSYTVRLYTRTNKLIETVTVSSSGEFSFPNKELDPFDKIFRFRYEVHDSKGKLILNGDL